MTEAQQTMTDALGDEIVIGNTYGYSQSSGGHHHVVIGAAVKLNPKKVQLKVISRRHFLYGKLTDFPFGGSSESVNVGSTLLFPVTLCTSPSQLSVSKT